MKTQYIPHRAAEWFIARIGKEINLVNGQTSTTIKIADEKMAKQLYFDAQFMFGVLFTDKPTENISESGDIVFSEASVPTSGTKQVSIQWSKVQEPNLQIPYNHITLDTPLGVFVINWKGWKEQPTYGLSLNDECSIHLLAWKKARSS